jgi:glycosyltransferase involved in cell wall biosynthesis
MIRVQYDHQIFSMQKYGGISRYFANLQQAIDHSTEFQQHNGVLFSRNHYLQSPGLFPATTGNRLFKTDRRMYKWNKRYSKLSLKFNNFDVFHPTYYDPYFLKYNSKPIVLTVHDMIHELFPEYFAEDDIYASYKKRCITNADHLIAISECTKKDLQRFFDIPDEKVTVVHHGIDLSPTEYSNIRVLPEQYILFVGERVGYKNFKVVAEAFCRLSKQKPELFLVLAGGGFLTDVEIAYLANKQIRNKIIQVTATDKELNTLYKQARCFVFPSLYEGFGLPILEAFKNECPVILSNCSCFPEIAGEQAALYFDAQSSRSLADQMHNLLTNQARRAELISHGQNRLVSFAIEDCVIKTLAVYKGLQPMVSPPVNRMLNLVR